MRLNSNYFFEFGDQNSTYYKLLCAEDFDFKTKDIVINIKLEDSRVLVNIDVSCILDLKIATTALIKSLEIIDKTLNI